MTTVSDSWSQGHWLPDIPFSCNDSQPVIQIHTHASNTIQYYLLLAKCHWCSAFCKL